MIEEKYIPKKLEFEVAQIPQALRWVFPLAVWQTIEKLPPVKQKSELKIFISDVRLRISSAQHRRQAPANAKNKLIHLAQIERIVEGREILPVVPEPLDPVIEKPHEEPLFKPMPKIIKTTENINGLSPVEQPIHVIEPKPIVTAAIQEPPKEEPKKRRKRVYSHQNNVLKFRIMDALLKAGKPMTTAEIEIATGVPQTRINTAMWHYMHLKKVKIRGFKVEKYTIKLPYFSRLEQKSPTGGYRYSITKSGGEAYKDYKFDILTGRSLNKTRPTRFVNSPAKLPSCVINEDNISNIKVTNEQLAPYLTIMKEGREVEWTPETVIQNETYNRVKAIKKREERKEAKFQKTIAKKRKAKELAAWKVILKEKEKMFKSIERAKKKEAERHKKANEKIEAKVKAAIQKEDIAKKLIPPKVNTKLSEKIA